jgi:lipopolysaccharide/colanic/teichoic acid biosynthesis glycosyltransferase
MLPIQLGAFFIGMFKRLFDLFFGLVALTLALPLMALSVLMVYLEDGSPVIFRQARVGKDGNLFVMFKIRTMVKNAEQLQSQVQRRDSEGNLIHKTKDDARVTRVGRVLRRFSLDELPQLFNVLGGTMSLVGPRPEIPSLAERYEPWQRQRLDVLPGMTGWWQITSRNHQPMYLYIEDDLYYIQNYSIWLDLQIIIRTIWVVLSGRGAY